MLNKIIFSGKNYKQHIINLLHKCKIQPVNEIDHYGRYEIGCVMISFII